MSLHVTSNDALYISTYIVLLFTGFHYYLHKYFVCAFFLKYILFLSVAGYYSFISSNYQRQRHFGVHSCPDCGKSYSSRGTLSRHRRQECQFSETAIDFKCLFCNYVTRRQDTMKKHVLTHAHCKRSAKIQL